MSEKDAPILIAGAGIGGLTTAACLLARGYSVRVFEQAPELGEVGAGIQISANASKVLRHLGVLDRLLPLSVQPRSFRIRLYRTGDIIQEFPLGEVHERTHGAPYLHLHRQDFHDVLAQRVREFDSSAIVLGAKVESFEEDEDGVSVSLADGRIIRGAMLVGADGIRSVVRDQIRNPTPPAFTGQVAWRATVPARRLPDGYMDRIVTLWAGPRHHIVIYYLRAGELLNFVGVARNDSWEVESWTVKAPWEELKDDFAGWHDDVQTFIDAVDRDQCYRWALNNRVPSPGWSSGRAVIIGDAAHATLPYLAQGAAMAIEDAAILVRVLDEFADMPLADRLAVFEANRFERTRRIVLDSTAHGHLYQQENEDQLREALTSRDLGRERAQWLYSYDPLAVDLVRSRSVA